MNKQTRNTIIILVILLIAYLVFKFNQRTATEKVASNGDNPNPFNPPPRPHTGSNSTTANTITNLASGDCVDPAFENEYNGRECAGSVINEKKMLKLGDEGCEVLLLQQRLNSMQHDAYILAQTGNSQGDFKNTQQSAATQMRIFTEGLKELGADIGKILLPAFTKIVKFANSLIKKFKGLDHRTK